ncbi:hypothetical protein EMPS_01695 [Entomortierella parvispora]|uniref:Uncharacterized protein n=1 Tax=Entomortierella parvispora TaxID=205924 RepID=A0A9P3H3F5_9FUNG|nr:hypothetical protein EMPS_01695 [Entomortierella parvispora]
MIAGVLLFLRLFLVIFALGAFGIDLYLIKIYTENKTVVFLWKFYVQFGLEGLLFLIFFISAIIVAVQRQHYRRHSYSAPEYSQVASSSFYPSRHGMKSGQCLGLALRSVFITGVAIGLLYVSVKNILDDSRKILFLPFPRDSAQADAYDDNYSKFDPHNLLQCPKDDSLASLSLTMSPEDIAAVAATKLSASLICNFDRSSVCMAVVVGFFAVIEVLLSIAWENKQAAMNSVVAQGARAMESGSPASSGFAMFTPWKKSAGPSNAEFDHTRHVVQMEPYPARPVKP